MRASQSQAAALRDTGMSPAHRCVSSLMQEAEQTPGSYLPSLPGSEPGPSTE